MKKTNSFQKSLTALTVLLLVASGVGTASAQMGGGGGGGNGSGSGSNSNVTKPPTFTLQDFNNFVSKMFKVPSAYPWDKNDIADYSPVPSRTYEAGTITQQSNAIADPPESCIKLTSDGSSVYAPDVLYKGDPCAKTDSAQVPSISTLDYEGTWCEPANYNLRAYFPDQYFDIITELPRGRQYDDKNFDCPNFKNTAGTTLVIPGKPLKGIVKYKCMGGLWRLREVSCSDAETMCPGGPGSYNLPYGGINYPFTLSFTESKVGVAGPIIACAALNAPPAGYHWTGSITSSCNGAGGWDVGNSCAQVADRNVTYPDCTGPDVKYQPTYIKAGIQGCLTLDETKYFWIQWDGNTDPPTVCADTINGCV